MIRQLTRVTPLGSEGTGILARLPESTPLPRPLAPCYDNLSMGIGWASEEASTHTFPAAEENLLHSSIRSLKF